MNIRMQILTRLAAGAAALCCIALAGAGSGGAALAAEPSPYAARAREVTEHIQKSFFDPRRAACISNR